MLFNSWVFLVFFTIVLALYGLLKRRGQNTLLLVASYTFYAYWDWRFLGLILFSTVVDYFCGLSLEKAQKPRLRKLLLTLSCCANLGLLGFFKYFNFFIESATTAMSGLGYDPEWNTLHIVLPVGISFYTFQTMSYTIDIYRKKLSAERNFLNFALFVSYFPQLVAGPIERATNLIPQIRNPRSPSRDQVISGLWLILKGLFLKMVIADNLAIVVNRIFDTSASPTGFACLIGVYAFAFQIYGDFAGYSKIARGVSKLLGIELMRNFNMPYLSQNPSEFWRRWHISLSSWLRDYLYIPLGGNRTGKLGTRGNLLATMTLGGLWHGAALNFIVWGIYQGALLLIHRTFSSKEKSNDTKQTNFVIAWTKRILFFQLVCLGWLLFRVESLDQAFDFASNIVFHFEFNSREAISVLIPFCLLSLPSLCLDGWTKDCDDPRSIPLWNAGAGAVAVSIMILAILFFTPVSKQDFVYFQF